MGGGCNDAQAGKAPLSAAEVGGSFVLQYYRTLTTDKDNLHKYYKDESICSRGFEGASPDQITYGHGVDEIREEIRASSTLGASRAEINCIQSQESKQGGILVLVLGYFAYSDSSQKVHFTQVFFLDKQTEPTPGYFVQNDILRYVTGKPEQSELQAQPQTDLPPPRLPPPQPPMLPVASAPARAENQPCAVVPDAVQEETPAVEEPAVEQEEEEGGEVAEEEDAYEGEEEEQEEAYAVAADTDAADAEAAAAVDAAVAADLAEAEDTKPSPPSWASMASKLKEGGGGQLGNSKVQGFALPAPAKAKAAASQAKVSAASSTTPVLPPPSAAAKAKAKAAAEEAGDATVRLWLSRLPMEPTVENQELLDCLNKQIAEAGLEGHAELDHRRDLTKDWVYVTVSSQAIADELVRKDRKVTVRGKILKLDVEKQKPASNRRGYNNSGEAGEAKAADGGSGSRGPRRGKGEKGKAGGDTGGKGAKGGADAGTPSERSSRGGGRRGGEKGGGGGSWRAQS